MSTPRILVAGIGNIFLGDDAFGVEVVRGLATRALPDGVRVVDFGIRGIDLAYALLEGYDRVILVDAMARGNAPGTLTVMEPDLGPDSGGEMRTHEMVPERVLASARALGAKVDRVWVLGCEPESFGTEDEPQMGLSAPVKAAVAEAVNLVESLIAETREAAHA